MFDFCVNVEVGLFNVVRLVTTLLSSLLSGCYLHFSPKSCMIKKSNGNKYKNTIKLKKQVGMVVQKSTQTRVVGKITDEVHPISYFQVTWFL